MIILLNTSTPTCQLTIADEGSHHDFTWQADRQLAHGLLGFLQSSMAEFSFKWDDITGIGVFLGPGSYTGLRIGITVLNTIADANAVAIVGAKGDDWQVEALARLAKGENDLIALPFYGGQANITTSRK